MASIFRIKKLLERQLREDVDPDEFAVGIWELLERVPSTNKRYMDSKKPYPARLPSLPELLNILSEEKEDFNLGSLGVEVLLVNCAWHQLRISYHVVHSCGHLHTQ